MSTVLDVIEGLKETGTGEAKIERMQRHAIENPSLEADAFCAWVDREVSPVTARKARHLAAGQPLSELLGVPPPSSREKQAMDVAGAMRDLVEILAEKGQARQAEAQEQGIGAPPAPRRPGRHGGLT